MRLYQDRMFGYSVEYHMSSCAKTFQEKALFPMELRMGKVNR